MPFDEGSRPLLFENIPWPLLSHPTTWYIDKIEWTDVEDFFATMERLLPLSEYRELVREGHLRFHPDKWKARRILTAADDAIRDQLEAAGNIVAQALTPLWSDLRKP